jgi:hypothetical protein
MYSNLDPSLESTPTNPSTHIDFPLPYPILFGAVVAAAAVAVAAVAAG